MSLLLSENAILRSCLVSFDIITTRNFTKLDSSSITLFYFTLAYVEVTRCCKNGEIFMAKIGTLNFMMLFFFVILQKVNTKDDLVLLKILF